MLFAPDADRKAIPLQFNITATYEFFGRRVEETTRVDLRAFLGSEGESDPLVEELERIRQEMEKVLPALARGPNVEGNRPAATDLR